MFVREYCKTYNKKAIAKKFAMTGPAVTGMLARKPVFAAIHKRALAQAKAADMDQMWVLQNLREVVERCMDGDKFDASCALRGLELIGKSMAMFTDRVEKTETRVIRIESNVKFDPLGVAHAKTISIPNLRELEQKAISGPDAVPEEGEVPDAGPEGEER